MSREAELGRLTPVAPREVWRHEALDFTRWLLRNADVLSLALGMDLALEEAEHAVGSFSLDLVGTDRTTGEKVIVENQLETSDHPHLGQLLTYAGGVDPTSVVWVAPRFRDEHRAALEWLNERTDARTRFFAVQVEVVRIGDSLPAPLFTLVVRPNDWGKAVKASSPARGRRWTERDLLNGLMENPGPDVAALVKQLLDRHLTTPGASLYWGDGISPSVTATVQLGERRLQPWSVYLAAAGQGSASPVWALNLEYIHKGGRGATPEQVAQLVRELESLPGVSGRIGDAPAVGWKRRPSIPLAPLIRSPGAVDVIGAAMEELHARVRAMDGGPSI